MTTKIRSIFLLAGGLGSTGLGLWTHIATHSSNTSLTSFSAIFAGLLCLQAMQVQTRSGNQSSAQLIDTLQGILLILGALTASMAATGLLTGQTITLLGVSALLSALGVCSGLPWRIPGSNRSAPRSAKPKPNHATSNPEGDRQQGTVKWFNNSKGFGFISRTDQSDVFVHFRALRDPLIRSLNEGERVEFIATPNDKGVQAEDVVLLDRRTQ